MTQKKLMDKAISELARNVTLLVHQYEKETGLTIRGIDVDRFHTPELGMVPQVTISSRVGSSYFIGLEEIRKEIKDRNES